MEESVSDEARERASTFARTVKSRARDFAEQQKAVGADQVGGVAHAMEVAAGELEGQMPLAAEYIEKVAGQLGAMASALRERKIDDILGSTADFARWSDSDGVRSFSFRKKFRKSRKVDHAEPLYSRNLH